MRLTATLLLILATLLSTSHARFTVFNPIQLPRLRSAASAVGDGVITCPSWRLTVETHNRQGRNLVPPSCVDYVQRYMLEGQYRVDCEEVANVAIEFAKSVEPAGDGKDVWVFDIDETTLSNLPYYNRSDVMFGSLPQDRSKFRAWVERGEAPAIQAIQRLYNTTLSLGFKNVILTGLSDQHKDIRTSNLKKVGYDNWEKLIFRGEDTPTAKFKSDQRTKLVNEGYRIIGNVGDQWGDLTGANVGNRTFKVPNPMTLTRNVTKFYEWVAGVAEPPLPAVHLLHKKVLSLVFKTVIMTNSSDRYRDARIINLNKVGYYNWEKLILMFPVILEDLRSKKTC